MRAYPTLPYPHQNTRPLSSVALEMSSAVVSNTLMSLLESAFTVLRLIVSSLYLFVHLTILIYSSLLLSFFPRLHCGHCHCPSLVGGTETSLCLRNSNSPQAGVSCLLNVEVGWGSNKEC